ncbi:calpain 7 [Rhizophlyctis rosea]|nr:calpain 7 [Rhizophlyctis rosea]
MNPSGVAPGTPSIRELYSEAWTLASWAVEADSDRDSQLAVLYYTELSQLLMRISKLETDDNKKQQARRRVVEYVERAELLKRQLEQTGGSSRPSTTSYATASENKLQRAQFLFDQAVLADEKGLTGEAYQSYIAAAEVYIDVAKAVSEDRRGEMERRLAIIVPRAEELRQKHDASSPGPQHKRTTSKSAVDTAPNALGLTPEEISVLKKTSYVNGKTYLPWLDIDMHERFWSKEPFTDPDGLLRLSPKQTAKFGSWQRPFQFMAKPKMIQLISSASITQDVVTDCSFVASLCVKLVFNGIPRKIVVDDLLPCSKTFVPDKQWRRMHDGCKHGDVLITIATGQLSEQDAEALGLVPSHAYAVLDMREILGRRLLKLKNPWSHKRWKGPYSHIDEQNWTSELKSALNYDQAGALEIDDGTSKLQFFRAV